MKATVDQGLLGDIVFSADEIAAAIRRLADEIRRDYAGEPILLVGVLKGAILFASDLMRQLSDYPIAIDFIVVSSYGTGRRGAKGDVRLLKDLDTNPAGRNILLVEYLLNNLQSREPRSLRACALMDKPFHRTAQVHVDYVGMTAPDAFLVGYGLDYQEAFRNLPYICKLSCPPNR